MKNKEKTVVNKANYEFSIDLNIEVSSEFQILEIQKQVYEFLNSMDFSKEDRKRIAEILTIYASIFIEASIDNPSSLTFH